MLELLTRPYSVLWRHRDLAMQFAVRVLLERTKGSFLGILWQVLAPLLMMVLYTFVFGVLFKGSFSPNSRESSIVYGIGIYIGLSILGMVNDTLAQSPHAIMSSPNLVKKVVFPLEILPISSVAFPVVQGAVGLTIASLSLCYLGYYPQASWLWIPVVLLPILLLSAGLAWMVASLTVYFKDLVHVMAFLTQILFWSSGIFYAAEAVAEYPLVWSVLQWNPLLLAIDEIRKIMIWDIPVSVTRVVYLYLIGSFFWYAGYSTFYRLRNGFADIL